MADPAPGAIASGADRGPPQEADVRGASDRTLLRVAQLIDQLPERGETDRVLQPVRNRLARLRPARPMHRNRLLFTPFNHVLASGAGWHPGAALLPREMLGPVLALLDWSGHSALPPATARFDPEDAALLQRTGAALWGAAAEVLDAALSSEVAPGVAPPPDWQRRSGLPRAAAAEALRVFALVFRHAHALQTLPSGDDPALRRTLTGLLGAAARAGASGWAVMLALLLDTAAAPDLVAELAEATARGEGDETMLRSGIDYALTGMLGRLERGLDPPPFRPDAASSLLLDRLADLRRLEAVARLDRSGTGRRRIDRLRQAMQNSNRGLFEQALRSRLGRGEIAWPARDETGEHGDPATEADMRRLRRFALAVEPSGGGDLHAMIEAAAVELSRPVAGAARVGQLRLIELLAGSGRALRALRDINTAHGAAS